MDMDPKRRAFSIWYFVLALLGLIVLQSVLGAPHRETLAYSEFRTLLDAGRIRDILIDRQRITGLIALDSIEGICRPNASRPCAQMPTAGMHSSRCAWKILSSWRICPRQA